MFSGLRSRLGLVNVTTTPKYVSVEGIATHGLMRDMQRLWGSKALANNMFSVIRSGEVKFLHFFALDFLYMMETLYTDPQTRMPRRVLRKVIDELKEKTWLGDIDKAVNPITDVNHADHVVSFPLKPFQKAFVQHFGVMVPTYRLRGYMLDAGPGTGKTVTDLVVADCLHADKVVIISPKNAVERVWVDTVKDIVLKKRPYWSSASGEPLTTDKHYYITHYESLSQLVEFIKGNKRDFKNTFVILDESHNFNRLAADRTQTLIELCQMDIVSYCLWASGTPILALGVECIPFLRCVDPMFNPEAEERFRKIYGRDAKRANDILRNRIGHLKFHVPKQDVVDIPVNVQQVKVKMPDGDKYTLKNIGEILRKFIEERTQYYEKHRAHYEKQYYDALAFFEPHLRTDIEKRQYKEYQAAIKVISSGFDPKIMKAEAMLCNRYELKTIIPALPNQMKPEFKSARSVVKYVKLKIMGEALGRIVGGMRSKCHLDMIAHIDFGHYIDGARKKTLIFTSYVEVLEQTADLLFHNGYEPARVYGATNKDLSGIVKKFYDDPDLNPLCATFQSLSTAVPLTIASDMIMLNQPFRDAIRTQTIARAARLGQDGPVNVWDFLLDTGNEPNISTRSNDILEWSASMVASIVGVNNVDLETLTLEAKANDEGVWEYLSQESAELQTEVLDIIEEEDLALEASENPMDKIDLPMYLYHGSAFRQQELKPGFAHTGELVKWDNSEDNTWLYASDDKDEAILLGISSAIEKAFKLDRYQCDTKAKKITITVSDDITIQDIHKLHVVVYTIKAVNEDGWMANFNPANNIKGEYKTQRHITSNILRCEDVNVGEVLRRFKIEIIRNEASMESLSTIIDAVKKAVGIKSPEQKRKYAHNEVIKTDIRRNGAVVTDYVRKYYGSESWLSKQQFNEEVSSGGIAQELSVDGKFLGSVNEVSKAAEAFAQFFGKHTAKLIELDHKVDAIYEGCQAPIMAAIKADDKDKFEKLMHEAIDKFNDLPVPAIPFAPFKAIGGEVIQCKPTPKAHFSHEIISPETKVKAPGKIPALKSDEILAAAKLIEHLISSLAAHGKSASWLDFEDGSDFSHAIHEYDEPLYMDFYDRFYFQTAADSLEWGMPSYGEMVKKTVVGLLTWMDRSVKGSAGSSESHESLSGIKNAWNNQFGEEKRIEHARQANKHIYLYHGTKTDLDVVHHKGLTVNDNGSSEIRISGKKIWLTPSKTYAGLYGTPLMVKVSTDALEFVERLPFQTTVNEYAYSRDIPAKDIIFPDMPEYKHKLNFDEEPK